MLTLIVPSKLARSAKRIERAFGKVFKNKNLEVVVSLISDQKIKKINKIYRRINQVTDVLSFAYSASEGEIVISPKAAKKEKLTLERLIVHGVVHIMGYNHEKDEDAEKMEKKENNILKLCQWI